MHLRNSALLGGAILSLVPFVSLAQQFDTQQPLKGFSGNLTQATCHEACSSLLTVLGPQIVFYDSNLPSEFFTGHYFSKVQSDVRPECLVFPESAQDVSSFITIVREHECIFAIRSGGHAMFRGASNAPGGITIDLRRLNKVELSEDNQTASVGPGLHWGEVYDYLDPFNLTVVGGRVSDVGVGGFLLGGGISFISRRYGWGCDNVRNFEIVLADGSIVQVNQKSNPDLYWALRGGGKNFGIVTRFDLETHPNPRFWGGFSVYLTSGQEKELASIGAARTFSLTKHWLLEYLSSKLVSVGCLLGYCTSIDRYTDLLERLTREAEDDPYAQAYGVVFLLPGANHYAVASQMTHGAGLDAAPAFGELYHLKSFYYSLGYKTGNQLARELEDQQPVDYRNHYEAVTFKHITAPLLKDVIHIFMSEMETIRNNVSGLVASTMPLQLITKDEIRHMSRNGGNAIGLKESDGPLLLLSTAFSWRKEEDDEKVYGTSRKILERAVARGKELGKYHPYVYQNYAAKWQDVYAGYPKENVKKLRKIRDKVDPDKVFTRLVPGYFGFD